MAMPFDDVFKRTIKIDMAQGKVVALMGPPGIGKSSFIKSLAEDNGCQMFTVACNQMAEKSDLNGARTVPVETVDADGNSTTEYMQRFFPHEAITKALDAAEANQGETVYLVLEEVNRTDDGVTSGVLTMTTDRMIGHRRIPENVVIVVAGNIKGNVSTLDDASISRFALYQVGADAQVLIDLMGSQMNRHVRAVLEENPELVFTTPADRHADSEDEATALRNSFLDGESMKQFTTPRTIESVSDWLNAVESSDYDLLAEMHQQQIAVDDLPNTSDAETISRLEATLIAHTGDTRFTQKLLVKVIEDIMSANKANTPVNARAAQLTTTLTKPSNYEQITKITSRQDMQSTLSTLNEREISDVFVYALYDVRNQPALVETLVSMDQVPDTAALQQLMAVSSDLNQDNLQIVLQSNTNTKRAILRVI